MSSPGLLIVLLVGWLVLLLIGALAAFLWAVRAETRSPER